MKKILYTIGILMFMALVVKPMAAIGADTADFSGDETEVPFSTARLSSKLFTAIGIEDPNGNLAEVFGEDDEAEIGQDLYATIYEKTQNRPQQQAFKNIAAKYGMTEAEMVKIQYGNYAKILEEKPTLTQGEAYNKMAEIQQEFAEEKDILQIEADIKAAVEPNEMFANDDLSDSGFDLINDLQIIENLLFLKSQPISVGGGWTPSLGGDEAAPADGGGTAGSPPAGGSPSGSGGSGGGAGSGSGPTQSGSTGGAETKSGSIGGAQSGGAAAGQGEEAGSASGAQGMSDKINPNDCLATNNLEKALNEFEAKKATDKNFKDNSAGQSPSSKAGSSSGGGAGSGIAGPGATGGGGTGSGAASGGPGAYRSTTDFMQPVANTTAPAAAAPAADWLKPKECDQVFCLFVDFVMAPATTSFQDTDNCVACHAEKINDILKKTIEHTLVPSKAPGNLGESAKCKNAMAGGFDSVNMNIYATPIPVQTPANDDLIYGKSIADEWLDFCNAMSFPFSCEKKDAPKTPGESSYGIPPSMTAMAAAKVLTNASAATTMAEADLKIATATQGFASEKAKDLQRLAVSESADSSIGFYNPLKLELDQMNSYFINIRDILKSLHEEVVTMPGPQACKDLGSKSECT